MSGFDGAPAQQYLALIRYQAATDDFRVFIVNRLAFGTDMPRPVVIRRNGKLGFGTALAAKIHLGMPLSG